VYIFSKEVTKSACTDVPAHDAKSKSRIIDLDVDIGADAVDYKCVFPGVHNITCPDMGFPNSAIANQESLSGLETEMRKLEGIVKEIVEEMDYLKKREEKFQNTNGACSPNAMCSILARLT
jgi:hypothetical protein